MKLKKKTFPRHRMDNHICRKCYVKYGNPRDKGIQSYELPRKGGLRRFCCSAFKNSYQTKEQCYLLEPPSSCYYALEQLYESERRNKV